MRDVYANPGTICALVALSGNHVMFILHVCVDLITLLLGRLIEIGLDVGNTSITGVPGETKCPVAPASTTTILTAICILPVLKQVAALGKTCSELCYTLLLKMEEFQNRTS